MNRVRAAIIGITIAGVLSGPLALRSAQAANPALEWPSVWVALAGSAIAVAFVAGLQILMRNLSGSRLALWGLGLAANYFAASGVSALVVAAYGGNLEASSVFILAIGVGALVGVGVAAVAYRAAFAT